MIAKNTGLALAASFRWQRDDGVDWDGRSLVDNHSNLGYGRSGATGRGGAMEQPPLLCSTSLWSAYRNCHVVVVTIRVQDI